MLRDNNPGASDPLSLMLNTTIATAYAVNLLSSHISHFGRTDDEDVELWIRTVERMSQIYHGVSQDVLLLAVRVNRPTQPESSLT